MIRPWKRQVTWWEVVQSILLLSEVNNMQPIKELKVGFVESVCEHCDGCGLLPSASSKSFKVTMCASCNGHGVQLVERKTNLHAPVVRRYDADQIMLTRLERDIDPPHRRVKA